LGTPFFIGLLLSVRSQLSLSITAVSIPPRCRDRS
jgi:hypothetical protein